MPTQAPPRLCLIEDDGIMGESLCDRFRLEGYGIDWYRSARAAAGLAEADYEAVISDVRLPDGGGDTLFAELLRRAAHLPPFIFITGYGSIDRAVQLLKMGAADYVTKPFDLDQLVEKVHALTAARGRAAGPEEFLGVSAPMRRIMETIPRIARQASGVLITGESGVGKEHVARMLHRHAREREDCPFVAVNCGALPETLLEAELFGYEKGAFTGATRTRLGVFEQAHCGTLFLDEIGDMSLAMQVRLLRAIQERCTTRVGGETPISVKFRLFCATHRDLRQLVEEGRFREDLFYRVNVIQLRVPALRERREDILWFARRFLAQFAREHGEPPRTLHPEAEHALLSYAWPGNVRELKHCIERACILADGSSVLTPDALFDEGGSTDDHPLPDRRTLGARLEQAERDLIAQGLDRNRWQIAMTAADLGISRKNLWEKMKKLQIAPPGHRS